MSRYITLILDFFSTITLGLLNRSTQGGVSDQGWVKLSELEDPAAATGTCMSGKKLKALSEGPPSLEFCLSVCRDS